MEDRVAMTASEVQQAESEVAHPTPVEFPRWQCPGDGTQSEAWQPNSPPIGSQSPPWQPGGEQSTSLGDLPSSPLPCSAWGAPASFLAIRKTHTVTISIP